MLLGKQDNLTSNKVNLVSSKVTRLVNQDNLTSNKVNLVSSKVIHLDKQDNLMCNKDNLESSKGILLGRAISLTCSKANPLPSLANHLDKLVDPRVNQPSSALSHLFHKDNPRLYKDNLTPSKLILLGKWAHPKLNLGNLPGRWPNLHPFKDILLGLLNEALKWWLLLKLNLVFSPMLGPRLKLVFRYKVGSNPNLLTKRSLVPRLSMELNSRIITSNPRDKLSGPHTKIINKCRLLLIKITRNSMLLLQVKLVINGVLGGRYIVNLPLMATTPMDRIPMDKTLMGQARPDKVHGGNHHLVGTLVLPLIHGHRCPSILSYLS